MDMDLRNVSPEQPSHAVSSIMLYALLLDNSHIEETAWDGDDLRPGPRAGSAPETLFILRVTTTRLRARTQPVTLCARARCCSGAGSDPLAVKLNSYLAR